MIVNIDTCLDHFIYDSLLIFIAILLNDLHQENVIAVGLIQLARQFVFLLLKRLKSVVVAVVGVVGGDLVHLLIIVNLLQQVGLVVRVSLAFHFLLSFGRVSAT